MKKKIRGSTDKKKPKAFFGLPKICKFCRDKIESIDYKEVNKLRLMTTEKGKIIPRRISGNCAKHQRKLTNAIKRSRNIGFLPFTL